VRATLLEEPSLEFASGSRHQDPRFGIAQYGPVDLESPSAPRAITIGLIADQQGLSNLQEWLESCRDPIAPKSTDRPGLWPEFPGFASTRGFQSELVFDPRLQRPIAKRSIKELEALKPAARADRAADIYLRELETLVQEGRPDVVICQIPDALEDIDTPPVVVADGPSETGAVGHAEENRPVAFHDLLKARAMKLRVPLQLIRAGTYDPSKVRKQKRRTWKRRGRQDDATIAWNFFTALYYKAGGTPWRMVRAASDLEVCFVGVSFFRTPNSDTPATSFAQIYNQRGDGVVVRGGPAQRSTRDRQLHLSREDAYEALKQALMAYRAEHRHLPARIIVHKTSVFDAEEHEGMSKAAEDLGLDCCELVWITNPTTRLFRDGYHPPRRGTLLEVAPDHGVLYTRGSVEWYGTYPGMYVPKPIALRASHIERRLSDVAQEVMALTKMNWNSTRFDGRLPVSMRTARHVADIIKHLPANAPVEPMYAYYM